MSSVTKLTGRLDRYAMRGAAVLVVVMTMVMVIGLGVEGRDEANRMGTAQVGRQADGSVVVTTNQVLTPSGRQVEFRGRPLSVVLSPDGRTAAFLNGTYQAIILVDVDDVDRQAGVHHRGRQRLVCGHRVLGERTSAVRLSSIGPGDCR